MQQFPIAPAHEIYIFQLIRYSMGVRSIRTLSIKIANEREATYINKTEAMLIGAKQGFRDKLLPEKKSITWNFLANL